MKKILVGFVVAVISLFAHAEKPLKVGFIYVSPIGDAGWSYQHDQGRLALEKAMGDQIETTFIEKVGEGPEAERVIRKLAKQGYDLIFGTSFGYMNPMLRVAKANPKVKFEHATGYKTAKNMGNYSPRFYEGRYLAGIAAGRLTQNNVLGYVAAFPIPEVIRGINAFTLGAQSINPKVEVKVIWTNSWYDPGKETEAANSLLAQNADVLTHHTDSIAVVKVAESKGKKVIAYHSNMLKHGGSAHIGAVVHNWSDFYIQKVQKVLDNQWESTSVWQGLKDGVVDFELTATLPQETYALLQARKMGMKEGSFHPFRAPITNQQGKKVLAEGHLSDEALQKMDYFVKGVKGQLNSK